MMTEYDSVDELLEDYRRQDRPITTIVRKRRMYSKHAARSVAEYVLEDGYATIPGEYIEDDRGIFIDEFRDQWEKIEDGEYEWDLDRTIHEHVEHPRVHRDWVLYGGIFDDVTLASADIVVDLGESARWHAVYIPHPIERKVCLRPIEPPEKWNELKDVVWGEDDGT